VGHAISLLIELTSARPPGTRPQTSCIRTPSTICCTGLRMFSFTLNGLRSHTGLDSKLTRSSPRQPRLICPTSRRFPARSSAMRSALSESPTSESSAFQAMAVS